MNDSFTKRFALFIMMATASTSDLKINLDLWRGKLGSRKIKPDSRKKTETQKIKPLDDKAGIFRFKIGESGALLHDDFTLNHSLVYDCNFIASKTKIIRNSVSGIASNGPDTTNSWWIRQTRLSEYDERNIDWTFNTQTYLKMFLCLACLPFAFSNISKVNILKENVSIYGVY